MAGLQRIGLGRVPALLSLGERAGCSVLLTALNLCLRLQRGLSQLLQEGGREVKQAHPQKPRYLGSLASKN